MEVKKFKNFVVLTKKVRIINVNKIQVMSVQNMRKSNMLTRSPKRISNLMRNTCGPLEPLRKHRIPHTVSAKQWTKIIRRNIWNYNLGDRFLLLRLKEIKHCSTIKENIVGSP